MTLLVGKDLYRSWRLESQEVQALRGVSLAIARGEYVAIVGPSGSGKSTLLQVLGGIDPPTAGRVLLDGVNLTALGDRALTALRLERIGFVFQRFHLLPVLTALENVELPMAELGRLSRSARRARARELLEFVGLGARTHHRATQLSGGEMQRVAIARAIANEPAIILADEPTGELDAATGRGVMELLARLNREGATIVVVTHDDHLAAQAGRIVHMLDGRLA